MALTDIDGKNIVLGIIENISQRKAYEEELKYLALYDSLTKLPNRYLFFERLNQAIAQNNRAKSMLAVLILDLDKFKEVNDTLGHLIGDALLKEVAQRLKSIVCRESDIVARLGGDEFIILLSPISKKEDALHIAKKIHNQLAKPFYIEENIISISSSIGIALHPEHGKNEKNLVASADKALYEVKNTNKDNFKLFGA